jgi:hypothetical protein
MDIFKLFDPCGMSGDVMVNMQTILGRRIDSKDVNGMGMRLAGRFIERFERK